MINRKALLYENYHKSEEALETVTVLFFGVVGDEDGSYIAASVEKEDGSVVEVAHYQLKFAAPCLIFGSEVSFKLFVDESDVVNKCKDIWNNPEKYSNYKSGTEEAYYSFLKFLWVKYPNGEEQRLADVADKE